MWSIRCLPTRPCADRFHQSPERHEMPIHSHNHPHPHVERPRRVRQPGEPLRVGVGGPVGSGKTALVAALCRQLRDELSLAVLTNDIYTTEDADFLRKHAVLPGDRIAAVQTGGCPHTAIRDDITANLDAIDDLIAAHEPLDLILVESGGDNLTATFSSGLVDAQIFVVDVAGGDKVPRKGGPGVTYSDLLVVNKTRLGAPRRSRSAGDGRRRRRGPRWPAHRPAVTDQRPSGDPSAGVGSAPNCAKRPTCDAFPGAGDRVSEPAATHRVLRRCGGPLHRTRHRSIWSRRRPRRWAATASTFASSSNAAPGSGSAAPPPRWLCPGRMSRLPMLIGRCGYRKPRHRPGAHRGCRRRPARVHRRILPARRGPGALPRTGAGRPNAKRERGFGRDRYVLTVMTVRCFATGSSWAPDRRPTISSRRRARRSTNCAVPERLSPTPPWTPVRPC